jgi:iron complex outermembrane recepter protein
MPYVRTVMWCCIFMMEIIGKLNSRLFNQPERTLDVRIDWLKFACLFSVHCVQKTTIRQTFNLMKNFCLKNTTFEHPAAVFSVMLCVCVLEAQSQVHAQTETKPVIYEALQYFEIEPGELSKVLAEFAIKADSEIFYSTDIVQNKHSPGVRGMYSNSEALEKILEDSGLKFERTDEKIFLIHVMFAANGEGKKSESPKKMPLRSDYSTAKWEIEELLVTASKRSESLQDLAMSISALGYSELEKRALVSMEDYLSAVPGVNQVDRGVGRNSIVIRGVSADPAFEDPTVGVYFEEVPLTGRAYFGSADLKLVDVERVEILRGPQGTLYGAGSLAGTVRTIPVDPNLEDLEGNVSLGYSEMAEKGSDGSRMKGTLNIPLLQNNLAVRVSAYRFENSGYIENTAASNPATLAFAQKFAVEDLAGNKSDIGRSEYRGARVRLLWEPTNDLQIVTNYITQDLKQDGLPEIRLGLDDFEQSRLALIDPIGGGEKLVDDFELGNIVIKYDLGWMEMVSSTAVFTEYALRNTVIAPVLTFPAAHSTSRDTRVVIEELRFVSKFDGPLQTLVGLYYEDNNRAGEFSFISALEPRSESATDRETRLNVDRETDIEQSAVFGDLTYEVSNSVNINFGGRLFHYHSADYSQSRGKLVEDGATVPISDVFSSESGSNINMNFEYIASESSLIYFQYSEGFRLGNPQATVPVAACDKDGNGILDGTNVPINITSSKSDKIASKEIGVKYKDAGGHYVVNGAIYQNNWRDMPVAVRGDCNIDIVINAGEAVTRGFELESSIYFTPSTRFDVGISFIDAELTHIEDALDAKQGNRLAGSARYSINTALQHEFNLAGADVYLRLDYSRLGGFYGNLQETPPELGNYNLFHLNAGARVGNTSFEFYIKNLTNTKRLIWVDGLLGYPLKPRTAGFNVTYQF